MEPDLFSICDKVNDEKSFLQFLTALMKDREREVQIEKKTPSSPYGPGALGWENGTIEGFLESAIAWAEATGPMDEQDNPWQRVAQILFAGKTYE